MQIKTDQYINKILIIIILILSCISGYIIVKENMTRKVYANTLGPEIVFNEKIEFLLGADQDVNSDVVLSMIINGKLSEYDSIEVVDLNTKQLGEFQGLLIALRGDIEKEFIFLYKIIDTLPPVITQLSEIRVDVGTEADLNSFFSITDNSYVSNDTLEIEIIGEVDWYIAGEYTIIVSATDSSGNVSTLETIVYVDGWISYDYIDDAQEEVNTSSEDESDFSDQFESGDESIEESPGEEIIETGDSE